ncbi:cytochrome c3 family protein [Polycladidibacter hongkongensis]|uniref:cytochrome c3 family protein n=1 Tax=Polycladidibacter hongkongensis TaxID=1647556 RepID=UPI00083223A5|nr:tetratricopeptide repeat protein [Pseudovibrio hongkongensis]
MPGSKPPFSDLFTGNSVLLRLAQRFGAVLLLLAFLVIKCAAASAEVVDAQGGETIGFPERGCASCHAEAYRNWQASHHFRSMQVANTAAVLGTFDGQVLLFARGTEKIRLVQEDGEFFAEIWSVHEPKNISRFKVLYTFGYEPLQQYMVDIGKGRLNLLPVAWDSRSLVNGGQRWFVLYPDTAEFDRFYWRNVGQNWNHMCADCHSTNVRKNFSAVSGVYLTEFDQVNVSCAACHGEDPNHGGLSNTLPANALETGSFVKPIGERVEEWIGTLGNKTLQPAAVGKTKQLEVCSPCHARRQQVGDADRLHPPTMMRLFLPSLIENGLYYPDGQILDEVFVYGSFLQSEMAKKGVVCTNCHEPHSNELVLPIEEVCFQCHSSEAYGGKLHSAHDPSVAGAPICVDCHMPAKTYMQVDDRREHSFHVPNWLSAEQVKTPLACKNCHGELSRDMIAARFGDLEISARSSSKQRLALAFYLADREDPSALPALLQLADDRYLAEIDRASALMRLRRFSDGNVVAVLARAIRSGTEIEQLGAARGAAGLSAGDRWQVLEPLLKSELLVLRIEAAGQLVRNWQELTGTQQEKLEPALADYFKAQSFNFDRGFALTNAANALVFQGKNAQAEALLLKAIQREPYFAGSYINLARVFRDEERFDKEISTLEQGIASQPESSALRYAYALALIRRQRYEPAVEQLERATDISPRDAQGWFVLGLAEQRTGRGTGIHALRKAAELSADPQYLYAYCESLLKARHSESRDCVDKLREVVGREVVDALLQRH